MTNVLKKKGEMVFTREFLFYHTDFNVPFSHLLLYSRFKVSFFSAVRNIYDPQFSSMEISEVMCLKFKWEYLHENAKEGINLWDLKKELANSQISSIVLSDFLKIKSSLQAANIFLNSQ